LKQPLAEMQGKTAYIRPKVVGPGASESYMHRAALSEEVLGKNTEIIKW
jgi:hypothetical protein